MILVSLGTGLLMAGLLVFHKNEVQVVQNSIIQSSKIVEEVVSSTNIGTSFEAPAEPVRLRIPSIGVDANIQSAGLLKDGTMGIPTNFTDVAWYNRGARPGMPGSAVIDGHLDGKDVPEAVFYNLGRLRVGDLVEVEDSRGVVLKFKVVDIETYDYKASASEVFSGDATKARLNLITCGGNWDKSKKTYDERVVVFTELI